MRRSIVYTALAVLLVVSAAFASLFISPAGMLLGQHQMTLACQHAQRNTAWTVSIVYPKQGGFGWRCYLPNNPEAGYRDVDIEGWCLYAYGLHARGGSTAYNWRCDD